MSVALAHGRRVAFWLLPPLFCLTLYWYGLKAWFQGDDFAWLGLDLQIHNARDFWRTLFVPLAQGTIRPWSERVYFMGLHRLFDLDALPWRICAFATQFANLALLSSIAWKLTRSRAAGLLAPVLWTANSVLVTVMSWSSAYNQILCGLFILSAFVLFLRYEDTGRARYYWLQFLVFALGFGALEINVVYPLLVLTYILATPRPNPRRRLLATLPLFALSLIFAGVHLYFAPSQTSGPYALHPDLSMLRTLWTYWQWSLVPPAWTTMPHHPPWAAAAATGVLTLALIGFVLRSAWRRQYLPLLFLAWFVIPLLPILPLRDHVAEYYLTLPAIGIALLGAVALEASWRAGTSWKVIGAACLILYFFIMLPTTRFATRWNYEQARRARTLVLGVKRVHELHPDKTILLAGIDAALYDAAVAHAPFRLLGLNDVFLTPESVSQIRADPASAEVSSFTLPSATTLQALHDGRIVVYQPWGDTLKNITTTYEALH